MLHAVGAAFRNDRALREAALTFALSSVLLLAYHRLADPHAAARRYYVRKRRAAAAAMLGCLTLLSAASALSLRYVLRTASKLLRAAVP